MAADEDPNKSCIFDPNFAIICSFFEKFGSLCRIKQHTFKELQEMIDSIDETNEIPPDLIDLHIRLMRKARKNVNPDRWQRTLAKFCYFTLPEDCWELEQKGYKNLNRSQRLRILLALLGAQFDYNVKFKTDVNKLGVDDLRLTPFGKDKNGNNYWLHTDEDLNLKIYKEDLEEEKWELVAKNRDELEKLIEDLMKERDPNRELEEIEPDDEEENELEQQSESEAEPEPELEKEPQPQKEADSEPQPTDPKPQPADLKPQPADPKPQPADPKPQPEDPKPQLAAAKATDVKIKDSIKGKADKNPAQPVQPNHLQAEVTQATQIPTESAAQVPTIQKVENKSKDASKTAKSLPSQSVIPTTTKNPFELLKMTASAAQIIPAKLIGKESSTPLSQTSNSLETVRPPLPNNSPKVPEEVVVDNSLISKINQKYAAIKPGVAITRDLLLAKPSLPKPQKPGLKLEQILKSKLAQVMAANQPVESETKDATGAKAVAAGPAPSSESPTANTAPFNGNAVTAAPAPSSDGPTASTSPLNGNAVAAGPAPSSECPTASAVPLNETVEPAVKTAESAEVTEKDPVKRTLSSEEASEAKKTKLDDADDEDREIEEPMMLITGVGSGKACDTGNETDSEKRTEPTSSSNATTNQLTHKVDDILKKSEHENGDTASTSDESHHLPVAKSDMELAGEKKKPKLWTIDAICSSDTKEVKNRSDDVSSFPNYSFNRDNKKPTDNSVFRDCGTGESYSIFNLAADSKEDLSISIPTNFYFGCNNQNPCFLPSERSPVNNYKPPNKSHNVKDIVDDLEAKESSQPSAAEVPNFNVENLCSKATPEIADETGKPVEDCVDRRSYDQRSGDYVEKALNLSSESATLNKNEAVPFYSVVDMSRVAESAPCDDSSQASSKAAEKTSFEASKPAESIVETEPEDEIPSASEPYPTNEASTVIQPEMRRATETKSAIKISEAPALKSDDEVAQAKESKSVSVIHEETEFPEGNIDSSSTSDSKIEQELSDVAISKPSETIGTDVDNCVPNKSVAVVPHTEAVNEETNEKTDVHDVRDELVAVKLPDPVPSVSEKPASGKLINEVTHQSDRAPSPVPADLIEEIKSTDVQRAPSLTPPAGSPLSLPIEDSSCVAEQSSKEIVEKQSTPGESSEEPVEKVPVQSGSIDIIDTAEKAGEESTETSSTALELPKTELQPAESKPQVFLEQAVPSEPLVADEKLSLAQESTASELVDNIKSEEKSAEKLPAAGADTEVESKNTSDSETKSKKIDAVASNEQPPQKTMLSRTKSTDEVVTSSATDAPTLLPSKENKATNEGDVTIRRRGRPPKEMNATAQNKGTCSRSEGTENNSVARLARKRSRSKKGTDEPKQVGSTEVEKPAKTEDSIESNSAGAEEKAEAESDAKIKMSQTSESPNELEEVAKQELKGDASKSTSTQASKSEADGAVAEKPASSQSGLSDPDETKPATSSEPTATSDKSSNENATPQTGRRKSRRTEASRLLEEIGQNEEPAEKSVPKRATRRSHASVDVEEHKSAKGARSKTPVAPVVEGKRGGRKSQLVVPEKAAAKEATPKKGKGKASAEEPKRGETSKKAQPPAEKTPTKQTPATKKGRGKKLGKEKVDDAASEAESEAIAEEEAVATPNEDAHNEKDKNDDSAKKSEKSTAKKRATKKGWITEIDVKNIAAPNNDGSPGIRQSRRIAQLKIREQSEIKYVEPVTPKKAAVNQKSKPVTPVKKNNSKSPNKKKKSKSNRDDSEEELREKVSVTPKKKKKKDSQKNFDVTKAWKGSSDSSSEEDEAEEEDHFEEDEEENVINDASDHEFSPESDIDDDDYAPVKRARTAHSKPEAEDKIEKDDRSCQSCGAIDRPEWILLCDACDEGWHASCLKPPILSIPEGDWFCPPCQHNKLITGLQKFLITYDRNVQKKANEELRKKRLEYVDISFSNIIIDSQSCHRVGAKTARATSDRGASTDESSEEESEEEEEEPLYQLRVRRQANVSHRLNEYEELMNSAIQSEDNIQIIDKGPAPEPETSETPAMPNGDEQLPPEEVAEAGGGDEVDEEKDKEEDEDEDQAEEKKVAPVILNLRNIRKKPPRLTELDVSSDDDRFSDEDFKGSSAEDQDEDDYGKSETDSDEAEYRSGRYGPVRRSTRARVSRYDNDFINDNSDDDEDYGKKSKKKKRVRYSESDSEEDSTWGKRKRNKQAAPSRSTRSSQKKRKRIRFDGDSDEEKKKTVRSRIKYGLDESEDEHPQRRTRGKKINYVENLESDSDEDDLPAKKKAKKILSDDDEYVDDQDGNDQNAQLESSKSDSEEDNESKSDSNSIAENPETAAADKPAATTDSTKAVSPTQPSVESKPTPETKPAAAEMEASIDSGKKDEPCTKVLEKIPVAEEAAAKPSMPVESAKIVPPPAQQSYGDIIQEDPKTVPTIVDANSSLKGMQSMTQSLPQVTAATAAVYAAPATDPKYPPTTDPKYPPTTAAANFTDVGVRYEESDGDKVAPPIRVVSPSKLYGMQDQKRPPVPPQFAPHVPPPISGLPPNRMMIPHTMPSAMQIPGPLPMISSPQMRHPLPNTLQQPGMGLPPNMAKPPSKSPRKSRSKKQQEQERLEREAMEAASRGPEEMMPSMHMLKGPGHPPAEMNMPRPLMQPQMPPFSTATTPPFMPYPNQPHIRFPPQSPPSSVPTTVPSPVSGNTSKRVKITPTRMRMASPQNIMRFPRAPGAAPMYRQPQAPDTPTSGANQVPANDKGPMPPSSAPAANISPPKSEPVSIAPPMKPDQYYLPMSTYPPSQMPRGQPRPEFTFVRNPMPPSAYRQPMPGAPPPLTVTSSYGQMSHPYAVPSTTISGGTPQPHPPIAAPPPLNTSSPAKPDAAAKAPPSTVPSSTPPIPYSSPYLLPPPGATTASPPKMVLPPHSSPQPLVGPPTSTSPYQMLRVKQLPPTVAATMQSSTAPNMIYPPPSLYYTSPMVPTSYGQQLPPGPQQPSLSYPSSRPTPTPATQMPPTSAAGVRSAMLPPTPMPYQQPPTSSPADLQPVEYPAPTSQAGEFHYTPEPASVPPPSSASAAPSSSVENQNSAYSLQASTYDKEVDEEQQQSVEQQQQPQTPTEESSGEFGGLVSYFSSQREDDLDA